MPSTRGSSAASSARTQILSRLKDDHRRIRKAYREFQKIDADEDPQACEAIVRQILEELSVHATVEEELLYPAARDAIADDRLIDVAEVEHEALQILIDQLQTMGPSDEKYAARFTVLCEYVLHHVKEEEGEMFPQLERVRLDWQDLALEMAERRSELSFVPEPGPDGVGVGVGADEGIDTSDNAPPARPGSGRGHDTARRAAARRP
jgi:hemerythrin superfamily protein